MPAIRKIQDWIYVGVCFLATVKQSKDGKIIPIRIKPRTMEPYLQFLFFFIDANM